MAGMILDAGMRPVEPVADSEGIIKRIDMTRTPGQIELCRYESRERWLAARTVITTGTDAAVLTTDHPYSSLLKTWAKKTGILVEEDRADDLVDHLTVGNYIEATICGLLTKKAGVQLLHTKDSIAFNRELPGLGHSPDGFVIDDRGVPCRLAEFKNVGQWSADRWADGPPPEVVAQCQHGMAVCDMPETYLGVLLGGNDFRWYIIERDEGWLSLHREALEDFHARLNGGGAPDPTSSDACRDALKAMNPHIDGDPVALDMAAQDDTDRRELLKSRIKDDAAECKGIENRMIARLGGLPVGLLLDGRKWTYREQTRKPSVTKGSTFSVLRAPTKRKTK